ncbi:MAG: putative quinol monooxygenase [Phycicoccus sp.]
MTVDDEAGRRRPVPQSEVVFVFIAIVDFIVAPVERSGALAQLESERPEVRAMPGNLAFRVYASREDERVATIVHEWEDRDSFTRYLASEPFARSGAVIRPMMTGTPLSRRFEAELVETVP